LLFRRLLTVRPSFRPPVFAIAFAAAAVGAALRAAEPQCEVNVNVTLSDAGRKLTPPTRAQPAYYYPVVAGWQEKGAVVAGEKPPPRLTVVHELAKALAGQGYLVVDAKTPPPTLLLVLHWGYMNPQIDDLSTDPGSPQKIFFNEKQMVGLVGGGTLGNLDLSFERESVMQGAEDDRYFIIVSAYDFADAMKKKKTLLWQARMSTPSAGLTMADVIVPLVKNGAPLFGRETLRPKWVTTPVGPEGKVEVGTPSVVPDAEPPPPSPRTEPAKKP
jgi:hypothetical protein